MQVIEVPLAQIKVKDRFRKDLGNIDSLAETIKDKGLIQPITIDQNYNLKAGERRFRACERLKMHTIPAIMRKIAGVVDALEIELIENTQRKDLHPR